MNCKYNNCTIKASYGNKDDKIILYCKNHKLENMIYLYKICTYDNCLKISSFGYNTNKKEYLRCSNHKLDDMICFYQKCLNNECIERARYNYINEKGSKYCIKHKLENMVDKNKSICIIDNCTNYASFKDIKTNKNLYCTEHSKNKENILNSKNKICKYENCKLLANFGTIDDPRQYCSNHKLENMYDYIGKRCLICNNFLVKHNNIICSFCNPDSNIKKYEKLIYDILLKNNIDFIYNKTISFEYLRPDFLIKKDNFNIIIECDENQHSNYNKNNEIIRMNKIKEYLNSNCIFIRFNPSDFYINLKRKRISINKKNNELITLFQKLTNIENITESYIYYLYYNCNCINECNYIHKQNL